MRRLTLLLASLFATSAAGSAFAQGAETAPPPDESLLGEFVVTGVVEEHVPKIAILPSLSPALEDVIVRSVVRRDLELTGLFDVIDDRKAPAGLYGYNDPVDIKAWQALGAEAIVKVAARSHSQGKVEVLGLAYFLSVGKDPVYETKLVVDSSDIRITAHRITDALLGALTGRPGGFASRFTFSGPWGRNRRVFTMDADGHGLSPQTDPKDTAIAPTWGPNQQLFFSVSTNYSPFRLSRIEPLLAPTSPGTTPTTLPTVTPVQIPFRGSVYSVDFDAERKRMAVAIAENGGSAIYVGNPDGTDLRKVSTTDLATHPVFSPSGKLAWIGGSATQGSQRVYVDGKVVSPAGFTAAAPAFCDTEDGIRLVYAVAVGGDRQDLVMANERGQGTVRLTQNQGSNAYPACSPDGRMLAFFRKKGSEQGLYVMSLKRFRTQKVAGTAGESLRWAALPPATTAVAAAPKEAPAPAKTAEPRGE
ncbi:MAG: tolB protein [Myxococcales bacterium]|jgi:TolB protein|nr:tolB protein [Myxococcales bacterium]